MRSSLPRHKAEIPFVRGDRVLQAHIPTSRIRRLIGLGIVFAASISSVLAQTAPDAGSLLKQQEQLQKNLPERLPQREEQTQRPELQDGGGQRIVLNSVSFTGASGLVPASELQNLVADTLGKEMDFLGLQSLAERVTNYLKARGWLLARAYIPKQDITEGALEIAITAGRFSQNEPVLITPGENQALRINPERIKAIADRALPTGATAREDDLNRAILLTNDLPGIVARARLEPGDTDGETRVILTVNEGPLLSGYTNLDNNGSHDTGTDQINLGFKLNDPLGFGDQISLDATSSAGTTLARLGYSLPLWGKFGGDGWKLNLGYTDMRYDVRTATGAAAGLEGQSQTAVAGVFYPWIRSRTRNAYFSLSLTDKHLIDRATAGTIRVKKVNSASLALSGDQLDALGGGGLTGWSAGLVTGELNLDLPSDAAADATGYRAAGGYHKLTYSLTRLQKLPGVFTLFASLSGQQSGKNLDSSEKIYLGGPAGVRAYPGSEAGSDSGQLLNLEVRYDWPGATTLGNLQLQAFYDQGWATLHHDERSLPINTATGHNRYSISGAGFGLSWTRPGSYAIRASLAGKLGSNPGRTNAGLNADSRDDAYRIWLSATMMF